MGVLIFIAVLVVLIVVHEFGHLLVAKWSGMRVDEFGIGYPPRAAVLGTFGGTTCTLNWLPFGGFVKIFGENGGEHAAKSFSSRPRYLQALVLVAGVGMNLLLAYVLITGLLIAGTPRALAPEEVPLAKDAALAVTAVLPGSPAMEAGLRPGDIIREAEDGHYVFSGADAAAFTDFVSEGGGDATIALSVERADGSEETVFARPEVGAVSSDASRAALGVEVRAVGTLPLNPLDALFAGALYTWRLTEATFFGLTAFFGSVFALNADLSQVAGPVGIAGAVGNASSEGIAALISLTALISINLALINLLPIPALDGGRLLFVIIESVIRRPLPLVAARVANALGFGFLVLLMVAVTASDVLKLL